MAAEFKDKVAVVTGGSRGIGFSIAQALLAEGAKAFICGRDQKALDVALEKLRATAPANVDGTTADVSNYEDCRKLIRAVGERFGGLDILVNNAGGEITPTFLETRVDHIEAAVRFNVSAPFELSRLATPYLLERPGASIINISSIVVGKSVRAHLAHHTGKAAEAQLTRSMAADLGPRIRVNAILPGAIETDALRQYLDTKAPDLRKTLADHTRLRRIGTPEDVAYAAVYLASPAASWVTGTLLKIDGGTVDEIVPMVPDL